MLKRNGVDRLSQRWASTGLALGTRRLHYAWVIVALASVMGMVSSSVQFAPKVLVPVLRDPAGFGWSYGAIAFAFTMQWLVSGLVSPWVGWLGDRYGVRRMMVLGALLFLAGMLLTGTMTHLWQFYLFFGVLLGIATTVFQILLVSGLTLPGCSCGRPGAPPPSGTSSASISGAVQATISSMSSWWQSPWTVVYRRTWP